MILVRLMRALQITVLVLGCAASAAAQRGAASPASVRPAPAAAPQGYTREQIDAGRTRFAAQCGFCHGRDAAGGEGGTDLTRSTLVATDVRGDKILPLVRTGRADKGMPAFSLADGDLAAIVAFIHDQREQAASATGNRRQVDVADLQTGNADAGRRYFETSCARCHSATGDLKGVATVTWGCRCCSACSTPDRADVGRGRRPSRQPYG
jgi:cytochrome c oxidase cbb3-type subunit III